jgi:hypothetical protein
MARLEGKKAFAAILMAGFVFMVAGFAADLLVHPAALEKTGRALQGVARPAHSLARNGSGS